jgi:hypothetical protein
MGGSSGTLFSAFALSKAAFSNGYQSTGLVACCLRYGDFAVARRFKCPVTPVAIVLNRGIYRYCLFGDEIKNPRARIGLPSCLLSIHVLHSGDAIDPRLNVGLFSCRANSLLFWIATRLKHFREDKFAWILSSYLYLRFPGIIIRGPKSFGSFGDSAGNQSSC